MDRYNHIICFNQVVYVDLRWLIRFIIKQIYYLLIFLSIYLIYIFYISFHISIYLSSLITFVVVFLVVCIFQMLFSSVCVGSLDLLVTLCEVICAILSAVLFPIKSPVVSAAFELLLLNTFSSCLFLTFFCFRHLITKVKFIRSSNSGGLACCSLKRTSTYENYELNMSESINIDGKLSIDFTNDILV